LREYKKYKHSSKSGASLQVVEITLFGD